MFILKLYYSKFVRKLAIYILGGYYFIRTSGYIKICNKFHLGNDANLIALECSPEIAVILHLYYESCWEEIECYLSNIDESFDLFISLGPDVSNNTIQKILTVFPKVKFYNLPNIGRDIAPFIYIYKLIDLSQYKAICKIHSKKSKHRLDGILWRNYLYGRLLGSKKKFHRSKDLIINGGAGIVSPRFHKLSIKTHINENKFWVNQLLEHHGDNLEKASFHYVGGSMFWFQPNVFKTLRSMELSNYECENSQIDGTLAHGLERYLGYLTTHVASKTIKEI